MTAPRLCSRCKSRARARAQRWCQVCRAESKRHARQIVRGTPGTGGIGRKGPQFGVAPGPSLAPPAPPSRRQTGHLAPLQRRRWLDYDACAEIAAVSPHTIARACLRGQLPFRIVTWKRRNFRRRKRLVADVDLLNWIYLKPHPLPQRRAWREPDAGCEGSPS
jgi:hypothetical protein